MGTYKVSRKAVGGEGPVACRRVRAYLPRNFYTLGFDADYVYFAGDDADGWSYEGYVKPRLASGLLFSEPVSNEDPMKFTSCVEG